MPTFKFKILSVFIVLWLFSIDINAQSTDSNYKSLTVNNMSMAYRDIGQGPVLVLLHGFTGTGEQWNPLLTNLSASFRLIIPDLRGHGRSINPLDSFTHAQLAQDVFKLLDQLSIQTFSAIGSSMGAMTLLHISTQQPKRVSSMVLVGGSPYLPESAREIYRSAVIDSIPEKDLKWMAKAHSGGMSQVLKLMKQFHGYKDSYNDVNFTKPYLASITTPTLIVQGDRDQFFPATVAMEMYSSIPNSYLWIVPNTWHDAGLEEPKGQEIFTYRVMDFLKGNWKE